MPLPVVTEVATKQKKGKKFREENDTFESAQTIEINQVVAGIARQADVDYYKFSGKKGQTITAELFGMRLGRTMFDPYLALLDSKRFELATCDDTVLTRRDPFLSVTLPADDEYTLLVRESSYQGNDSANYLLQVSESPRPTSVHPPVGSPGEKIALTFRGSSRGPSSKRSLLP